MAGSSLAGQVEGLPARKPSSISTRSSPRLFRLRSLAVAPGMRSRWSWRHGSMPARRSGAAARRCRRTGDRLAARDRGGRLQSHPPAVPRLPGTAELAKWRDTTHPPGLQFFDVGRGASDHEFVGDAAYIHLEIEALHRRAREMPG